MGEVLPTEFPTQRACSLRRMARFATSRGGLPRGRLGGEGAGRVRSVHERPCALAPRAGTFAAEARPAVGEGGAYGPPGP